MRLLQDRWSAEVAFQSHGSTFASTRRVRHERSLKAVAVIMEFPGGTLEQYDQIHAKMGFAPDGQGAPGACFIGCARPRTGCA